MTAKIAPITPHTQPERRRVLLVEDNLDAVHSMAVLIRMMGHEVQFAINGLAALEIAKAFKPHLIFLDIGLPDFKGDKIAVQFKYEAGFEHTRIIAITGLPISDVRERALQAGCEAVYAKPLAPTMLEDLIERPLSQVELGASPRRGRP